MDSLQVFILLELFVTRKINKFDNRILRDFRSIVIGHIASSESYISFMHNLTVNSLLMDKSYCSLLMSFKRYVRKVQKIYEGNYNNF